jgi:hypothetical protein
MACLAACASAAAGAGCGGSDAAPRKGQAPPVSSEQRGVLGTVDALQSASRRGDGRAICADLFTPQLVRSIENASKRSCAEEVRARVFSPRAELAVGRDIAVSGDRGTAVVRDQDDNVSKLFLVKRTGRWRIDRVQPQKAP